jgi:hypothetical protein
MRAVYYLYQVEFIKHNSSEMTIEATTRRGKTFTAYLRRTKDNYWLGSTDFGESSKKIFKGIVVEFFKDLVQEAKDYDQRWYALHCVLKVEVGGNRRLTWEETHYGSLNKEEEPTFKGGVKFYTEL